MAPIIISKSYSGHTTVYETRDHRVEVFEASNYQYWIVKVFMSYGQTVVMPYEVDAEAAHATAKSLIERMARD